MADDVPRNIERAIENAANLRSLNLKDIRVEEEQDDGTVYRVIVNDPDAEEGENPAFFVLRPDEPGGMNLFGERLEKKMGAVRKKILGVSDDTDQELEETRQQLEESGHPAADGDQVQYGPGPQPDTSTLEEGGYSDEYVTTRSTSEVDLPDPEDRGGGSEDESDLAETTTDATTTTTMNNIPDTDIDTETFHGSIAETALDAQEMMEKGHDKAHNALLEEIQEMIDARLGDDDG